jgi:hypothetical protein
MNRLRRISLLLSVALAAVVARVIIDGPNLLSGLTTALGVVLLLCSLALRRQGVRLSAYARVTVKSSCARCSDVGNLVKTSQTKPRGRGPESTASKSRPPP